MEARAQGARTWADLGKHLNIYSYSTAKSYKDVWHAFGHWVKSEMGLRDMEKVTGDHVRAYLECRIGDGVKWSTFQKEAASLEKFERAMNMFAEAVGSGRTYDFSRAIDEVRQEASRVLDRTTETRAYEDPKGLIQAIQNETHQITASIQYESGARIYEVSLIHQDQMKGYARDPITGRDVGVVRLDPGDTKGGKGRDIMVSPETYEALDRHIETYGVFHIDYQSYIQSLRASAEATNQEYHGSHGLRWNFAQERFSEVMNHGYTYEQALAQVSWEMGHERPDITLHYLQS